MPREITIKQARAQAIYMDHLARIAQEQAGTIKTPAFDLQGRLIIDVTPTDAQLKIIISKIIDKPESEFEFNKQELDKALGKRVTPTTTISLDINKNDTLKNIFYDQLKASLIKDKVSATNADALLTQFNKEPKGSIIALQQEFHFHLALVSRLYQKVSPKLDAKSKEMAQAHQDAMIKVNELVMEAYAKALKGAVNDDGTLNIAKLNKSLDKARKELLPKAHIIMMQQIIKHTGVMLSKEDIKKNKAGLSLKHLAEQTTAIANDIMHLDTDQGLAILIAGSENTAHHRVVGTDFAHRQLITHSVTPDGQIKEKQNHRIQIRTPSPVVKEGLKDDTAYIADVIEKLGAIKREYDLPAHLSSDGIKPKAFIYNSYTAFNDLGDDLWTNNYQTQSAVHMLRGAHWYNKNQLNKEPEARAFCLVQNISVNGFGDELGYDTDDDLANESTLMTEMALVHTLYDVASPAQQVTIQRAFDAYEQYLITPNRDIFFSLSNEGIEAKNLIQQIKNEWVQAPINPNPDHQNILENAKSGLKNLMAHNVHFKHEYSKLFQVLSVISEEVSLGGCKSANERAQAINGRVAVLDSLINGELLTAERIAICAALEVLANGNGEKAVTAAAQQLKTALDTEYNRVGLQNGASIVSLADQGASAKVEAKKGKPGLFTSRNYAEEQASIITNLHQSKSGSMQAHKDLTKHMLDVCDWQSKSFWDRIKAPLGPIAAVILSVILLPITLVYAGYVYFDNAKKDSKAAVLQTKNSSNPDHIALEEESYSQMSKGLSDIPKETSDQKSKLASELGTGGLGLSIARNLQSPVPTHASTEDDQEHTASLVS